MAAMKSAMARLGHKEDDANPPHAPVKSDWSSMAWVENPIRGRTRSASRPIAAAIFATMPPSVARREVEGEPIALAQFGPDKVALTHGCRVV